jgi:hypothetical protein
MTDEIARGVKGKKLKLSFEFEGGSSCLCSTNLSL